MEEMNTSRISAMFTADTKFEIWANRTGLIARSLNQDSNTRLIKGFEGVERNKFEIQIPWQE